MKNLFGVYLIALVTLCPGSWAQTPTPADGLQLTVVTDRSDALYHVNDPVEFQISILFNNEPVKEGEIEYVLSNDGANTISEGRLALAGIPLKVTGTLSEPGFLRCQATYIAGTAKKTVLAGAGMDPLNIKPSLPPPDDFDSFWADKKKKLAEVPMNPVLKPIARPDESIECFDLQLDCLGGKPVSGYLARPKNAQPKSLPAVLWTHSAGVDGANLNAVVSSAQKGFLALDINAHGIPNGASDEFYRQLSSTALASYPAIGSASRETCYFLGMYLRIIRALDFLTSQPEWDGKVLVARGSSQGGGQSLVAGGLDSRVTLIAASVPAMCDHTGKVAGWPRLVPVGADGKPDPKVFEAARYFDAMNFATRTHADAILSVGFIDNTCRATSVYAAYNNLPGKKQIFNRPLMGHAFPPELQEIFKNMIQEHVARVNGSKSEREKYKIAMLGDSVTVSRLNSEDHKLTHLVKDGLAKNFESAGILMTVINAGKGGDTAKGGFDRLKTQALFYGPDLVTISFGLNDTGGLTPDEFLAWSEKIITTIQQDSKAKILLLTATPFNNNRHVWGPQYADKGGLDEYMDAHLCSTTRALAKKYGLPLCDLHEEFKKALQKDATLIDKYVLPDGVHLTDEGNDFAAKFLVESIGEIVKASAK